MARGVPQVQYAIPTLEPWQRNLLIGLFLAYVLELILHNQGVPVYRWLAWQTLQANGDAASLFGPWQLLTRFLVQGASQDAVVRVLIGLAVLFFALPMLDRLSDRTTMGRAFLAGAVGATAIPLLLDITGVVPAREAVAMGWTRLVLVPFVVLGITQPNADVLLIVLPIKARWFLWGSLVVALLYIVTDPVVSSFEMLGVWAGTVGWWQGLGPGRRRRELVRQAATIEKDIRRFTVIEGGAGRPQGDQGDDDMVH